MALIAVCWGSVSAEGQLLEKLDFHAVNDFSLVAQGTNNWYYQYGNGTNYEKYSMMVVSNSRWARINDEKNIANFIMNNAMQPSGGSAAWTARVWVAPYDGVVRLGTDGSIRRQKTSSTAPATVRIAHTDSAYHEYTYEGNANGKLWSGSVDAGDTVGIANPYDLEVAVSKGDRLYFEMTSSAVANAELLWTPMVTYIEAASFSADGEAVDSIKEVNKGASVTCEMYDWRIEEPAYVYPVLYDESGRMRAIGQPATFDTDERKAEMAITVPSIGTSNSFDGWRISYIALTGMSGRYYPVTATSLSLK